MQPSCWVIVHQVWKLRKLWYHHLMISNAVRDRVIQGWKESNWAFLNICSVSWGSNFILRCRCGYNEYASPLGKQLNRNPCVHCWNLEKQKTEACYEFSAKRSGVIKAAELQLLGPFFPSFPCCRNKKIKKNPGQL